MCVPSHEPDWEKEKGNTYFSEIYVIFPKTYNLAFKYMACWIETDMGTTMEYARYGS